MSLEPKINQVRHTLCTVEALLHQAEENLKDQQQTQQTKIELAKARAEYGLVKNATETLLNKNKNQEMTVQQQKKSIEALNGRLNKLHKDIAALVREKVSMHRGMRVINAQAAGHRQFGMRRRGRIFGALAAAIAGGACTQIQQQADATLNQANPVQNQWYTVLETTNIRIFWALVRVAAVGETLAVRATIDGIVRTGTIVAAADTYQTSYIAIPSSTPNALRLAAGTTNMFGYNDYEEGRIVKIEVRKTTNNGNGNLIGRVIYALMCSTACTFELESDALLNQAAPVQNQWYTVLDDVEVRLYSVNIIIQTTAETLEMRLTMDGIVFTASIAAVAGSDYYTRLILDTATILQISAGGKNIGYNNMFLDAKELKVEVRKTTNNGAGNLQSKAVWSKLP